MGRAPCCEKVGLKKGRWTAEEDEILAKYIQANGEGSWRSLPKNAGLLRCGKSCRLRWVNYLRANLNRGKFSSEEEEIIIKLHASLGNRWSFISSHLPGRTDNDIKNYWNAHLSRKIHTFWRQRNETVPTMVNVVSAVNKDDSDEDDVSIQRPEENVSIDDGNVSIQMPEENFSIEDGDVSIQRPDAIDDGNVSIQRTEENVPVNDDNVPARRPEENVAVDDDSVPVHKTAENVSVDEYIALPATPTQEKETLPSTVLEGYMDLDTFAEDKEVTDLIISGENRASHVLCSNEETPTNNSMLCPRGEEEKTDIFKPFDDFDGEMLCFNDIMDNVPLGLKEIWTSLEKTQNCGTNISEEREIGALSTNIMANSEALESAIGESVACSSITSFFDDNIFDWDWESVVQAADDQQCVEEENILSRMWDRENIDERKCLEIEDEKQLVDWLLS